MKLNRYFRNMYSDTGKKWNIEEDGLIITTTLNLTLQKYALESFREHLSVMQKRLWNQYQTPSGKRVIRQIAEQELKNLNLTERAGEINIRQIFDWNGSHTDSISVADSLKQALLILHAGLLAMDPLTVLSKPGLAVLILKPSHMIRYMPGDKWLQHSNQSCMQRHLKREWNHVSILIMIRLFLQGYEDWSPENYDHTYGGKYSLAGALALSMNIPTFNLFMKVGFEKLDSLWKKMGFSFPLDNNPSLALGTAEAKYHGNSCGLFFICQRRLQDHSAEHHINQNS